MLGYKRRITEIETKLAKMEKEWGELNDELEKINYRKELFEECKKYISQYINKLVGGDGKKKEQNVSLN